MAENDIRMELWGKPSLKNFPYTNIIGETITKTFPTHSVDEEDPIAHYLERQGKRPN